MCNQSWNKHVRTAALGLGIVSFLFGLLTFLIGKPEGHSINTLLGMFTGFGAGIIGVAVWMTVREKVLPKEKLEQEVSSGFASDMMSDVLAFVNDKTVILDSLFFPLLSGQDSQCHQFNGITVRLVYAEFIAASLFCYDQLFCDTAVDLQIPFTYKIMVCIQLIHCGTIRIEGIPTDHILCLIRFCPLRNSGRNKAWKLKNTIIINIISIYGRIANSLSTITGFRCKAYINQSLINDRNGICNYRIIINTAGNIDRIRTVLQFAY